MSRKEKEAYLMLITPTVTNWITSTYDLTYKKNDFITCKELTIQAGTMLGLNPDRSLTRLLGVLLNKQGATVATNRCRKIGRGYHIRPLLKSCN